MGVFRFINKYFQKIEQEKQQYLETKQRRDELSNVLDRIVNIDLFNTSKTRETKIEKKSLFNAEYIADDEIVKDISRQKELAKKIDDIVNIKLSNKPQIKHTSTKKEINIIDKINIEKMNLEQLKNTYLFVKKSIIVAEQREKLEQLEQLKQLKIDIKRKLLENNNGLDYESIKFNIMYGDLNKLDYYRDYLLKCYDEYKNIKYDDNAQQVRITILTLLKLIEMKKQLTNKRFVKKVA